MNPSDCKTSRCRCGQGRRQRRLLYFLSLNLIAVLYVGINMLTVPGYEPDFLSLAAWCVISDFIVNCKGPECSGCPQKF